VLTSSMKTNAGVTFGAVILNLQGIRILSETDACIPWTGARSRRGYGLFTLNGKQVSAHRVFWEWANGRAIPPGFVVMHSCDNPPCVNPRHLSLGTAGDNVRDCAKKGRRNQVHGEAHGMVKLSADDVREIRRLYRPRVVTLEHLGLRFGVCAGTIGKIVKGDSWGHLGR
jgi:hypothetical protein